MLNRVFHQREQQQTGHGTVHELLRQREVQHDRLPVHLLVDLQVFLHDGHLVPHRHEADVAVVQVLAQIPAGEHQQAVHLVLSAKGIEPLDGGKDVADEVRADLRLQGAVAQVHHLQLHLLFGRGLPDHLLRGVAQMLDEQVEFARQLAHLVLAVHLYADGEVPLAHLVHALIKPLDVARHGIAENPRKQRGKRGADHHSDQTEIAHEVRRAQHLVLFQQADHIVHHVDIAGLQVDRAHGVIAHDVDSTRSRYGRACPSAPLSQ